MKKKKRRVIKNRCPNNHLVSAQPLWRKLSEQLNPVDVKTPLPQTTLPLAPEIPGPQPPVAPNNARQRCPE